MIAINKDIRDIVYEMGHDETIVFDNPDFDKAIIGVTHDGKAVYDYDKMVYCLMEEDNISEEEAIDFIDYNTIGSLSYAGYYAPIVVFVFNKGE